jgi:predicted transcriptional regulator
MKKGRTNKVTACLSDEALKKLEELCKKLDRSKSWTICHLILAADDRQLLKTFGGDPQ